MKWFALFGMVLLLAITVLPSINAEIKEPIPNELLEEKQFEKLLSLSEELISLYDRNKALADCDCITIFTEEYTFPIICQLLYPLYIISTLLESILHINLPYNGMIWISWQLNCDWW